MNNSCGPVKRNRLHSVFLCLGRNLPALLGALSVSVGDGEQRKREGSAPLHNDLHATAETAAL